MTHQRPNARIQWQQSIVSTSGRRAPLGADQAERLASSTEADWGGRSHGGPDHGVVLPAAGGGWALSGAQGGANTTFALLRELSPIRCAGQLIGLGFWLEIISNTQAGPTPQWAPGPARAPPGGPRRPPRACLVCPGVR